jgi:hypothetical protein
MKIFIKFYQIIGFFNKQIFFTKISNFINNNNNFNYFNFKSFFLKKNNVNIFKINQGIVVYKKYLNKDNKLLKGLVYQENNFFIFNNDISANLLRSNNVFGLFLK